MLEKCAKMKSGIIAGLLALLLFPSFPMPPIIAQQEKVFVGAWPYQPPPVGHFNTFVTDAINPEIYWVLMEQPLGLYFWANNSWLPILATDWTLDPVAKTFSVTLRQGVKWSDGSIFTAKDVVSTFYIGYLMDWAIWKYIDYVTATDDYTVIFHMARPTSLIERFVLREHIRSYSTYGNYSDQVRSLLAQGKDRNSDEMKALLTSFIAFRPETMVVTGPFMIDKESITEAELHLVKHAEYWDAARVKFDRIKLYNGETPQIMPYVLAKEVDYATHGFPVATTLEFQELGIRILPARVISGPALCINHRKYPLNLKEVRWAIAHAMDREAASSVTSIVDQIEPRYMCGMIDTFAEIWVSETARARMNPYEYDPAKAARILEDLGFTKGADGVWVTPNGTRLEYELIAPAEYVDWFACAEVVARQLTDFGIKTTLRGITFTEHFELIEEGNFELAIFEWGAAHPHPYFSYYSQFWPFNVLRPGMGFPMVQETESVGTIDFEAEIIASAEGLDIEAQKAIITRIALAFNELLPYIPIFERVAANPALEGVRVTGWPPDDDPLYKNDPYADSFVIIMILTGILRPVEVAPPPPPGPDWGLIGGVAVIVIIAIAVIAYYVARARRARA